MTNAQEGAWFDPLTARPLAEKNWRNSLPRFTLF
jgi:hypothetical protein